MWHFVQVERLLCPARIFLFVRISNTLRSILWKFCIMKHFSNRYQIYGENARAHAHEKRQRIETEMDCIRILSIFSGYFLTLFEMTKWNVYGIFEIKYDESQNKQTKFVSLCLKLLPIQTQRESRSSSTPMLFWLVIVSASPYWFLQNDCVRACMCVCASENVNWIS